LLPNLFLIHRLALFVISSRKRALLQHLNATKQRLHRLQVLLQWCHKASAVAECKRVLEVASSHANAFREAADQLVYLHGELIHSKAPAYDVPTAVHVLSTGGYTALPNIIESELQVVAPGKGKNAVAKNEISKATPEQLEKGKSALRRLDFLIRSKLLDEGLPIGMRVERISNGEIVVCSTSKQYTATISLVPAPSTDVTLAKWTPPEGISEEQQQQQEDQEIAQPIKHEEGEKERAGGVVAGIDVADEDERHLVKAEEIDIDSNEENYDKNTPSEASLWRWRLISFQLLPTHPPALLPPHLVPWLIRNVEDRMWAASDIQQLIKLGKADLVVVPPPPMSINQRKKKRKEIDEKGREGLLPPSQRMLGSQFGGSLPFGSLPFGSLPVGGTMSGASEQITTTTGGADGGAAAIEAGAPGVIPIWAQSPLAALHAVLQHTSAKLAIGSVLMEEAKALETGGGGGGAAATNWSNGNLRISKLDERFGVRFSLWPRIPLLSISELTSIIEEPHHPSDDNDNNTGGKIKKEEEELAKKKGRKHHHPSLGWILQVEVPPPQYETTKISAAEIEEVNTKEKSTKKKESDGTITCVCVPPLRNPTSLKEDTVVLLSVWSEDGSLSTENLLLRASAQHAQVQLTALQASMMMRTAPHVVFSEAQHAQQLDEVLGVDTWKVDVVETRTASHAMPALQCSFRADAMLLLHFRLFDGQPVLSLAPNLTESGVEFTGEAENIVKKAQMKLNKKLEAVLTEVLPVGTTRSVLWATTITEVLVEVWKHLVALQRKEEVMIEALSCGFGRAVLPRCLEGVEIETGSGAGAGDRSLSGSVAVKETTVALRAPYFTSATLSSTLKESIPMGKQGSLACYLLADVTSATAMVSAENFGKRLKLALCWATPRGVPTDLRRILSVPVEMLVSSQPGSAKAELKKEKGGGGNSKAPKRKRDDQINEDNADTASITDFSVLQGINWTQLKQWCLETIAVHQLEAQLEAAECTAEPTEDKTAVRVVLSTTPWSSNTLTTVPSSTVVPASTTTTGYCSSSFLEFSDEEVQFSLDPEKINSHHPEQGAFIATCIGKKFSVWKNELEKHGLKIKVSSHSDHHTIQHNDNRGGGGGGGVVAESREEALVSFEKEKIVMRCTLQNGNFSAAQLVAKAVCVGATTTCAINLVTALEQDKKKTKTGQQEEGRYSTTIKSVDLDNITLKHTDSRGGLGGELSVTLHWSAAAAAVAKNNSGKNIGGGGGAGGGAGVVSGSAPSSRRLMIGSQASQVSQLLETTLTGEKSASTGPLVCRISCSPQLPPPLLGYLEKQFSVAAVENEDSTIIQVATFLSVLTSVASSAAVIQAVVLDPLAQHAAGLVPEAVKIETFSFEPATTITGGSSVAAVVSAAAAVGVCMLLVHQLGRSLQLQMVFQSSGAVMLRARQLPPTAAAAAKVHPVDAGGEDAWLQEAWSKISLENNITTSSAGSNNSTDAWRHVFVTLLPDQLGSVLTTLLCAVGRRRRR
jgi:hypothetical protein